uniref:Cilia-and flagella-associated protein 96 n=1 Tax=Cyprinus carpio carpio TaxID=630221 RepID=A0A9J7ZE58_CYPCA
MDTYIDLCQSFGCGVGSYYGTFGGPIQAMSALQNPRKPNKSPGKNFYTNPPKKGSGYGYPDVTLSKMVSHSSDPYDRAKEMLKREIMAHKSMLKGGAFRLNLHAVECFNSNPYKFDKPLQPPKKTEEKKHTMVPFKPSSPSKKVSKGDQTQCKNVQDVHMERAVLSFHLGTFCGIFIYLCIFYFFVQTGGMRAEHLTPTPPTLQNPVVPKRPNQQ